MNYMPMLLNIEKHKEYKMTSLNEYDVCLDDVDLNIVNNSLDRALDLMSNRIILRDDNTAALQLINNFQNK